MSLLVTRAWFGRVAFVLVWLVLARLGAAELSERLGSISTRARVDTGDGIMIAGFAVGPGSDKQVLIRGVGPGLTQFGLAGLSDPVLRVFNADGVEVAQNDNWDAGATLPVSGSVGAFPLATGSRDAVVVATLSPGSYTAQLSGVGAATGIGLIEVYDVTGAARMVGLSTRAQVSSDAGILIAGVSVASTTGARRLLVRAAGPALVPFGVAGALADPALVIIDSAGKQVAGGVNDDWSTGDAGALSAAFGQAGAFAFPSGSKDAALVVDLLPGNYTMQVSGVGGGVGVTLVEVYDLTPDALPIVSLAATVPTTSSASAAGVVTVTRTGSTAGPLTVSVTLSGTAIAGIDYAPVPTSVTIQAGAATASVAVTALAVTGNTATSKTATITLVGSAAYASGAGSATVTIVYAPAALYVTNLRPTPAALAASTASGTATLQLAADGTYAVISESFSGLSSPQTLAYVRLGASGEDGAYLFQLPTGQVESVLWSITDTAGYTAEAIRQAIREGRVYIDIQTASYPAGELRGQLFLSTGSQSFTAPAAPPALPTTAPTEGEAARFLTQATFGYTTSEIAEVMTKGYGTWITDQIAKTRSVHKDRIAADFQANNAGGRNLVNGVYTRAGLAHRQNAWWMIAVRGDDQLRQRVAFALSELFVISDDNAAVRDWQEGMGHYYDLLARNAFGNFRTLLEDVTLSPMMGFYLSHFRNAKASGSTLPDENYAREVMQLFTIGLNQLQPDGTLKLDEQGLPIATYDQTTVSEMAKVFTGWAYYQTGTNPNFRAGGGEANMTAYTTPMMLYPSFHDTSEKSIVGGVVLPANQSGDRDLQMTLDTLFNHTNTPPFISRQLIQRLVTSNPSPAYVYRVAKVFENNGAGVRGDLGAVVRAILLDYEARSATVAANIGFGKLKEPLLRLTALLRAFGATTNTGRLPITNTESTLAQLSLGSPTVFNFFEPTYVMPGALAAAGLYAPEYQILTATTAITASNHLYATVYANKPTDTTSNTVYLDYSMVAPLVAQPEQLVDRLNLLLAGGGMPTATRDRIVAALRAMPTSTTDTEKIRSAVYLTITTQAGAVQK